MFIEFFGFPASGKSSAAELLTMEVGNLQQTAFLYSHGKCISANDNLQSAKSSVAINNQHRSEVFAKLNLFLIIFSKIILGPVDPFNKMRFIKRLIILFLALGKSRNKIIICDEGFLQLYISAQMPPKKSLDLDSIKVDFDAIFKLVSHIVVVGCKEDVIKKRLSERVLDHSRSKTWGAELTSICLREYERTITRITQTYTHQATYIEEEKTLTCDMIRNILSKRK